MSESNITTSSLALLVGQSHCMPGCTTEVVDRVFVKAGGRGMNFYEYKAAKGKKNQGVEYDRDQLLKVWGMIIERHVLPYLLQRLPFARLNHDGVELDIVESKVLAVCHHFGKWRGGLRFTRLADYLCIGRRAFNHMNPPTQWDAAVKKLVELGYIEIDGGSIVYTDAPQGPSRAVTEESVLSDHKVLELA